MNCDLLLPRSVETPSTVRGKSHEFSLDVYQIGPNSGTRLGFEKSKQIRGEQQWMRLRSIQQCYVGMIRRKLCEIEDYLTHEYYPFILEYFEDFYGRIEDICVRT